MPEPSHLQAPGDLRGLVESFERAARAAGGAIDLDFRVAWRHLRVRLAGPALRGSIVSALSHLAIERPDSAPDLEAMVWDSRSTGIGLPGPADTTRAGVASTVWQPGVRILTVIDASRGRGVVWLPDAGAVPFNEAAAPLRVFLHLALQPAGLQLVHGAAVGRPDGGVLLVGRSGAGKSSTALACLGTTLGVAGDDYVFVTINGLPWVHSVYCSAKLNADQLHRFPALAQSVVNRGVSDDKPVMFLHPRWRDSIARDFPLRAAVAPRVVGDGPTTAVRVRGAALLAAIAPSTIFQLPGTGRRTLEALAALLSRLPCYELQLGASLADVPAAVEHVIEDAGR
ncbi:MAG: hypothetical protein ABR961_14720 [Thermoanaerobaculaceae bacterium]